MGNFEYKYFYEAIEHILQENYVKNKGQLAKIFHISPSKFSEILNKRMNPGLNLFKILIEKFNINANWLITGKGSMLYQEEEEETIIAEPKGIYNSKNDIIDRMERQLDRQEREIVRLEKIIELIQRESIKINKNST